MNGLGIVNNLQQVCDLFLLDMRYQRIWIHTWTGLGVVNNLQQACVQGASQENTKNIFKTFKTGTWNAWPQLPKRDVLRLQK